MKYSNIVWPDENVSKNYHDRLQLSLGLVFSDDRRKVICCVSLRKVELNQGWFGEVSERSRGQPLSTNSKGKFPLAMAQGY
eukprot:1895940-Pleurochrysis_carterae.AAC.1